MKKWYAVHCKSHKEDVVRIQLELRKIEVFYPRLKIRKKDQKTIAIEPYFPGYLFICIDQKNINWSKIKWVPFTICVVGYGGKPVAIPDHFISRLRILLNRVNRDTEYKEFSQPDFNKGDALNITEGPLEGYEAVFFSCKSGAERAHVLLQFIENRFVQIELPIQHLRLKNDSG